MLSGSLIALGTDTYTKDDRYRFGDPDRRTASPVSSKALPPSAAWRMCMDLARAHPPFLAEIASFSTTASPPTLSRGEEGGLGVKTAAAAARECRAFTRRKAIGNKQTDRGDSLGRVELLTG